MVHNVTGQVVKDADFFDREAPLEQLRAQSMRDHLLVLAPRRVGKTSLLHRFAAEVEREEGKHAIYVSVQGAPDELSFLRAVYDACASHPASRRTLEGSTKRGLKSFFRRTREVEVGGFRLALEQTDPSAWQERARELATALERLPGHWFFLVDEVPVFLLRLLGDSPDVSRARAFLEWFRSIRQAPLRDVVTRHWILAGSIGLDTVAHRHHLSDTVNDLRHVRLGAFDTATAIAFVRALAEGEQVPMSQSVAEYVVERAGWPIPYHLQVLFAELKDRHRASGGAPEASDVDAAFDTLLRQHGYFDSWHERLTSELGAVLDAHAREILAACAADPRGARRETLDARLEAHVKDDAARAKELRFLLDVLQNDGYLIEQDDRLSFRSTLLREFWRRRYA